MILCVKRTQSNKLEGSLRMHEETVGVGLTVGVKTFLVQEKYVRLRKENGNDRRNIQDEQCSWLVTFIKPAKCSDFLVLCHIGSQQVASNTSCQRWAMHRMKAYIMYFNMISFNKTYHISVCTLNCLKLVKPQPTIFRRGHREKVRTNSN